MLCRTARWLAALSLLWLTQGCSFVSPTFIRNLTGSPVTISIPDYFTACYSGPRYLPMSRRIPQPRWRTIRKLEDSVAVLAEANSLTIEVPARSTVLIGIFGPGEQPFDLLIIKKLGHAPDSLSSAALAGRIQGNYRLGGWRQWLDVQ